MVRVESDRSHEEAVVRGDVGSPWDMRRGMATVGANAFPLPPPFFVAIDLLPVGPTQPKQEKRRAGQWKRCRDRPGCPASYRRSVKHAVIPLVVAACKSRHPLSDRRTVFVKAMVMPGPQTRESAGAYTQSRAPQSPAVVSPCSRARPAVGH